MPFLVNANLRRHHPPAPGVVRWEWIDRCRSRVFGNERRRLAETKAAVPIEEKLRGVGAQIRRMGNVFNTKREVVEVEG